MFKGRVDRLISLLVIVGAVALIVLHGIWPSTFLVDFVTIILLVVILLSPYAPLVRRIKFGGFEAEIGKDQVEKLEKQAKPTTGEPKGLTGTKASRKEHQLSELAESEPLSAIADLGSDIEWKLHQILELSPLPEEDKGAGRRLTLRRLSAFLNRNRIVDDRLESALLTFADIRNKAAHGSSIDVGDAARVVASGLSLLRELDTVAYQFLIPQEVLTISHQEEQESREARYKVTTIVPYVPQPERRTYMMNMEQLDTFLEGYEEYGEYVISIERLQKEHS